MLPSHRSDTSVEQLPPEPYRDDDEDEAESPLLDHRGNDHLSMLGVEEGPDNPPPPPSWMPQYDLRSRIPPGVIRSWEATKKWTKGPQPPRPWSITPIAEKYQTLPIQLRDRYLPKKKHKIVALILYYFLWLLTFSLMVQKSSTVAYVPGYGAPNSIGCSSRMWSQLNGCGINGDGCRPFDNSIYPFRCLASCARVNILENYQVGATPVIYKPLVVGGPMEDNADGYAESVYRSDSFICAAAIHSGYITDLKGGCGVLKVVGGRSSYPGVERNGINSTAFDSYFPHSFSFVKDATGTCEDLRWSLLGVSVTYSVVISLFTTSPAVFFWTIFTGLYAHVAFVSDPPGHWDYPGLISTAFGRFVPAAFCMCVMYLVAIRYTLRNLKAQFEKTILWLGACWIGSLNNYTFDKIPISRLTPHDLKQQPGAVTALFIIILVILSIALSQAWFIRIEGLMPKYLGIYGILCGSLLLMLPIPYLNIRIHHYILGLLLLPGTRLQMRPSMIYQGLLVGFFINGIARWGFDSLLQTPFELRGDAPLGTPVPRIMPPIIHTNVGSSQPANITFGWEYEYDDYDGVSVLVNDVERFKGYRDQGDYGFTWQRRMSGKPEYFRFAFLSGSDTADYSTPSTWRDDLSWST